MGLIGSLGRGSQFCFFSRLVVMMWLLGCNFGGYFNRFYSGWLSSSGCYGFLWVCIVLMGIYIILMVDVLK